MTRLNVTRSAARLAAAATLIAAPASARASATGPDPVAQAVGSLLQADGPQALAALRALPKSGLSPADARLRACVMERLARAGPDARSRVASPFHSWLLGQFRAYWRRSLLDPALREKAEAALQLDLSRKLDVAPDWPAIEAAIQTRLAKEGRWALLGRTGVLRELMIWERQRDIVEEVTLPEGPFRARVVYLERFDSLGWGDWATCGRRGAGGWATADGLYAVTPRYESLTGEEFRVTFLAHEAQHFADLKRYPGTAAWELEFRAKLVELAQVRATRSRVLRKFTEDQSEDRAQAHGYANRRVLAEMTSRLGMENAAALASGPLESLNEAALDLLRLDTLARQDFPPAGGARS